MTNVRAPGSSRNSPTVGLIAGSSVAWCSRCRNTSNSRSNTRCSASASHVGGQLVVGPLDRLHLPRAVLPGRQDREEDVVAVLRQVAPAGGPLLVHRRRVAVDPEEVLPDVPQQLEPTPVGPGLDPTEDVGPGGGLRLEVPLDHRGQVLEGVEHREIELSEDVRREHQPAVTVHHERLHAPPRRVSSTAPCVSASWIVRVIAVPPVVVVGPPGAGARSTPRRDTPRMATVRPGTLLPRTPGQNARARCSCRCLRPLPRMISSPRRRPLPGAGRRRRRASARRSGRSAGRRC